MILLFSWEFFKADMLTVKQCLFVVVFCFFKESLRCIKFLHLCTLCSNKKKKIKLKRSSFHCHLKTVLYSIADS